MKTPTHQLQQLADIPPHLRTLASLVAQELKPQIEAQTAALAATNGLLKQYLELQNKDRKEIAEVLALLKPFLPV